MRGEGIASFSAFVPSQLKGFHQGKNSRVREAALSLIAQVTSFERQDKNWQSIVGKFWGVCRPWKHQVPLQHSEFRGILISPTSMTCVRRQVGD